MTSSISGPSEVEPCRRLYAHELERRLLAGVAVRPGDTVLELASGFGGLCLRLAERVRPGGRTICSDLRPERVEATRRLVERTGAGDIDVRVLDMLRLDLADETVDGIVCRWGFMFPVPPAEAFDEAFRVLRARRRLALAVWAEPERNPWISLVDGALMAAGLALPDDRRAPGRMFSVANAGTVRSLLEGAGFEAVAVQDVPLTWEYDSFDAYWDEEALIPGAFERFFATLGATRLREVQDRLRASMDQYSLAGGGYRIPGVSLVGVGTRPERQAFSHPRSRAARG